MRRDSAVFNPSVSVGIVGISFFASCSVPTPSGFYIVPYITWDLEKEYIFVTTGVLQTVDTKAVNHYTYYTNSAPT